MLEKKQGPKKGTRRQRRNKDKYNRARTSTKNQETKKKQEKHTQKKKKKTIELRNRLRRCKRLSRVPRSRIPETPTPYARGGQRQRQLSGRILLYFLSFYFCYGSVVARLLWCLLLSQGTLGAPIVRGNCHVLSTCKGPISNPPKHI